MTDLEDMLQIAVASPAGKFAHMHYRHLYSGYFAGLRHKVTRVLELGIDDGKSLLLWEEWFPKAYIVGIDANQLRWLPPPGVPYSQRCHCYEGDQADPELIKIIAEKHGPFDLVVDDAGHDVVKQRESLHLLFPHVRPGGCYVIEDVETSYYGGVKPGTLTEHLKDLIDTINMPYMSSEERDRRVTLAGLAHMHIHPNIVFLGKAV